MISIIIPALNEENYLPLLLESIKKQDFIGDFEIIVADAGSKDKTIKIAENYGCRIIKGILPQGPAKGRNKGAEIAQGELFLFLDADIIVPKNFLRNSLNEFEKRKLDIASYFLIPITKNILFKCCFNFFYNWMIFLYQKILAHGAMGILVKKQVFEKINGFDEEIKMAEDHYFTRKAAETGKFGIINSTKIYISLRRYETDGYLKTILKYMISGIYTIFFGPIKSDIFKYNFNHYLKNNKDKL